MYMFLAGLGLLVVVGLHQLLESRKVNARDLSHSHRGSSEVGPVPRTVAMFVLACSHCGFIDLQVCYSFLE